MLAVFWVLGPGMLSLNPGPACCLPTCRHECRLGRGASLPTTPSISHPSKRKALHLCIIHEELPAQVQDCPANSLLGLQPSCLHHMLTWALRAFTHPSSPTAPSLDAYRVPTVCHVRLSAEDVAVCRTSAAAIWPGGEAVHWDARISGGSVFFLSGFQLTANAHPENQLWSGASLTTEGLSCSFPPPGTAAL